MNKELDNHFFENIRTLLRKAQETLVKQVNAVMVLTYFELGKQIVEQEQQGKDYADYGAFILSELSEKLTAEFGKGYSKRNLELIRKFYVTFKNAKSPISQSLSWTHYIHLMRIDDEKERTYYQNEAEQNNWSVRVLERQINSAAYHRLLISKGTTENDSRPQTDAPNPLGTLKDPYVLEFLDLKEQPNYSETQLEQAIIDRLEHFLLELGKGFTFVGRQVRFTFDEEHFRVDLVFYNRLLRCFVLIDLKIGKLKHQDLGQMQMYVNYYDRFVKTEDELPTIGIILCKDKKDAMVEITLPKDNKQIFASKYLLYLPKAEELKKLIEE
ncbi:PDDEXK nuclease domain-containing protein [Runella sp.]|uniref:PDDEXK nuclease domain-containing protein n=1 Tax=Runella sp. TaxID=1960881 RepID=UPI003D09E458